MGWVYGVDLWGESMGSDLNEHLIPHGRPRRFGRGAINRHGLAVPGKLQREFLLHKLLNSLQVTGSRGQGSGGVMGSGVMGVAGSGGERGGREVLQLVGSVDW